MDDHATSPKKQLDALQDEPAMNELARLHRLVDELPSKSYKEANTLLRRLLER